MQKQYCFRSYYFLILLYNHMNIHSIRDQPPNSNRRLNNQNGRPFSQQQFQGPFQSQDYRTTEQNLRYAEQNKVLLISGRSQVKNPRQQHFWDMLKLVLCPTFSFCSLTLFLVLANIGMFIASLVVGFEKDGSLLQVSRYSLLKLGANYGPPVADGQVYRLISAIFLHLNFIHIFGNILSTFILVARTEYTFGVVKTLIIYLVSGISGNIFSLATQSKQDHYSIIKAGASTALFGMIGLLLGYVIINWSAFQFIGRQLKFSLVCQCIFLLVFVLLFTPNNKSIDGMGHLGGFLAGIWLVAIEKPLLYQKKQKIIRIVFGIFLFIQLGSTFAAFYIKYS